MNQAFLIFKIASAANIQEESCPDVLDLRLKYIEMLLFISLCLKVRDEIRGELDLTQNDQDIVIRKSDNLPTYHFAHVCDDHFMRVTTVTRDDSYISSVPYHLEVWDACGFKAPKFAHLLPVNKKEGDTVRKISKRKDPEAAVSFYHERGIPVEAIKLYFATIMNSNFEGWFLQNPDKSFR